MSERDLFLAALDLPPADRDRFLAEKCGPDAGLRQRVDALFEAHASAGSFLDPPPGDATLTSPDVAATADRPGKDEHVGAVLAGKYKLIEAIGEGGMGSVYLAQQTEPVRRAVAVKVIKAGMDSKAVLARFEAERQALALMDHPNIARVLDAGTTESGRPFFVMELVKGVPITTYCDERKLTPRQRLELFVPVCQAIQHAHQKGVIHRDVKPSNVLVALYDDRPVPKVIDFGVAKAAGQTLTDRTLVTGFGAVVGTPEYMSPEQASLNNLDVDTRSDVYSLGVLLYELLTGSTPVDRKSLGKAALLEILRIVREVEAPRPSARLSSSDTLPSVAANRGTEPAKLSRLMRGELDWLLLKALEKDRTRRYDSANGLARDIQRYLADEIVEARPPSAGYRFRRFVRRNRHVVLVAALVVLGTLVGATIEIRAANRLRQGLLDETTARTLADASAEGERQAKQQAQQEARKASLAAAQERLAKVAEEVKRKEAETNLGYAKKGNEILGLVFAGLDPKAEYATVADLRNALRDNLTKAVKELDGSAIGDPLVVAALQHVLGMSLLGLGEANAAAEVFHKASKTRERELGADDPATLASLANLAEAYHDAGQLGKARPLLEDVLKRTTARSGADDPETLTSLSNLAMLELDARQFDSALPRLTAVLKGRTAKLGADHAETVASMSNLALGYQTSGQWEKAVPLLEEALTRLKAGPGRSPQQTLEVQLNLAAVYREVGRLGDALPLLEENRRQMATRLGADHPLTLTAAFNLGVGYRDGGQLDRAVPLLEDVLRVRTAKLGADHPHTLSTLGFLGMAYADADMGAKAAATLQRFVGGQRKQFPQGSPHVAGLLIEVARDLLRCGQHAPAEEMLREALPILEKRGPDTWGAFSVRSMLGAALLGQAKYADAEPLLLKGYEGMKEREKSIPPGSTRIPAALDRLIDLYTATNKPAEAKKYKELRAAYREVLPPPRREK